MAKYAAESRSKSRSQTWEGIEGYTPEWIKKSEMNLNQPALRDKQDPGMMSKEEFADLYGFVYGDDIDAAYQKAVAAKYDEIDAQTRMARDTSLHDMASSHDMYLQTLRNQRAKGPQTGIMKGASMAAELQGMFGTQQNMVESQQAYQDQLGKLAFERGTAAEEARLQALAERNKVAAQMGQLGSEKYGYDVQNEAAYLGYLGEYGQNQAAMLQAAGVWNQAEGQNTRRKTSDQSSESYSYDDSANIAAAAQRYAADKSASAQIAAANKAAEAQRYAANKSAAAYKGSGGGGGAAQKDPGFERRYKAFLAQGLTKSEATLAADGMQPVSFSGARQGKANPIAAKRTTGGGHVHNTMHYQ